jgi:hypothetical protein
VCFGEPLVKAFAWVTFLVLWAALPASGFSVQPREEHGLTQNRMAWLSEHMTTGGCEALSRSLVQRSRMGPSRRRAEKARCDDRVRSSIARCAGGTPAAPSSGGSADRSCRVEPAGRPWAASGVE